MRGASALTLLVFAAACGGSDDPRTVTVRMEERSGSTQFGEAVLRELDGSRTRIEVSVGRGGAEGTQPVRIFAGSCGALGAEPVYALEDNVDGDSATEIEAPLNDLLDDPHAITVHETPDLLRLLAACGDIVPPPSD